MDGSGLKLEKIGQFFRVLMLRIPKILKKVYYVRLALSNKTHLSIVVVALQKHFAYDLSLKIMILAQN